MPPKKTSYVLCDTYEDASEAAAALANSPVLIIDCEGRNIGMPGGALSLIAVGDCEAKHIFLFDVLALSDKFNTLLAPLLSILRRADITKLVWDGRADFFEIVDAYGVQMEGVLDLQLAEVAQRGRRKKNGWRQNHTADYFKRLKAELVADPAALEGIHRLYGLDHCAGLFSVIGKNEGKIHEVVAMHAQDRSEMWMRRPLPPVLLAYAAHDIELIAKLYARFQKKGHYLDDEEGLKMMSARYMEAFPTRELRAKHAQLELCKFVPLEVLTPPQDGAPRLECVRCERVLSLQCFSTRANATTVEANDTTTAEPEPVTEAQIPEESLAVTRRLTLCRLCHLVARRNSEAGLGEWVTF